MPESPKEKPAKAESFVGNVMKYSIATYLGFLISGAALIIKGVLPADTYAVPATFMAYTMSLMNLGMLGLDQALLRFYREPPEGTTGRGMFLACVRLSLLVMLVVGYGFLLIGGELGFLLFWVAVAALILTLLGKLIGKVEDLEKRQDQAPPAEARPLPEETRVD